MANETLKAIGEDINKITESIAEAEELVSAMKEAGEETATLEQDLRTLRVRKEKWERMLKNRGSL